MTSPSVRSTILRLSVSRQLVVILLLYALVVGVIWLVGGTVVRVHRAVAGSFDPETRADSLLLKYATTSSPEQLRRYLETLEVRTGQSGRLQLNRPEPNFEVVHASLRERHMPSWLPGARATVAALVPAEILEPTKRLETEGLRLLGGLAAATNSLHRESATASSRRARLRADVQQRLTELAALGDEAQTAEDAAVARLRHWQRDVILEATLAGFGLAVLVGFLSTTAVRRAAGRLRDHVTEVEQGNFEWRLAFAPGDDLAPVAAAFNEMAANVERAARKAEEDARHAGKALRELENIMETIPDVICILDLIGRLDLWNYNLQRATGLAQDALAGCPMRELFSEEDRPTIETALRQGLRKGRFEVEGHLRGPDGEVRPYHWTGAALKDAEGALIGLTVSGRDITERKALEEKLAHQAFHDPLTSLPNRSLFMNRLSHALRRTERRPGAVGVLFLDLDRFKVINDSLGHQVGDRLLVEVSARLRDCLRPADTVARLGGDEFAILLEDIEGLNEATAVAERIATVLEEAFVCEGREMSVT